ncbi:SOUL family heme-binding protein [Oceanicaulis sp.]|uniref:SOUL family heme-binding protein n=1 Tax=Oceanicaulis sp. TaxID=1924941 RepID=UPI003BAD3D11
MRLFACLTGLVSALVASPAMAAEEPAYRLVERDGPIEIRDYAPQILAEVVVEGDRRQASGRGFRPLAGYIFGDNQPREEIAMTAPVTSTRSGQEIAMTAPVTTEADAEGRWTVAFIMPSEWTMETLPEPMNDDVTLREQPARRIAVYQFSGMMNDARAQRGREALEAYLQEQGLEPLSTPTYASYDPPWVPGPFRRNEVWVEIAAR